jgi:hypothetical protein
MRNNLGNTLLLLLAVLFVPAECLAQAERQTTTLVVNGQTGQTEVLQINGRTYVDLKALSDIANGSVGFTRDRIILTVPQSNSGASSATAPPPQDDSSTLSRDFMKAGIESIAAMREWASPLASAIQNGYPVTESWVANYRDKAAQSIDLASAAATTDADRSALQLLNNEFASVREWSNNLLKAKESMDTGEYATSADALRNTPQSQKIIACGHFLASMLGSGHFQDDSSCH